MTRQSRSIRTAPIALAMILIGSAVDGCRSRQTVPQSGSTLSNPNPSSAASRSDGVLLEGTFERVARPVTGKASIVRRGTTYELVLSGVTVSQEGSVHVYLVGHDRPKTTRIVDETEMKYDMAELEPGGAEQRILLPSEPDPALRSVVLFYPTFGVNLAFAPLHPPTTAH